jgi:hypothetical protein
VLWPWRWRLCEGASSLKFRCRRGGREGPPGRKGAGVPDRRLYETVAPPARCPTSPRGGVRGRILPVSPPSTTGR